VSGLDLWCNNQLAGGGWVLVRYVPSSSLHWHHATDNALGTQPAYGTYNGKQAHDLSANLDAFSLGYGSCSFTELLFATGDYLHWAVIDKSALSVNSSMVTVEASDVNSTATQVPWENSFTGGAAGPFVPNQVNVDGLDGSTDTDSFSMLYAEDSYSGWGYWREHHSGAYVFIRNEALCGVSGTPPEGFVNTVSSSCLSQSSASTTKSIIAIVVAVVVVIIVCALVCFLPQLRKWYYKRFSAKSAAAPPPKPNPYRDNDTPHEMSSSPSSRQMLAAQNRSSSNAQV